MAALSYTLLHPITKRMRPAGGAVTEETVTEIGMKRPNVIALCATDRAPTNAIRNLILLEKLSGWSDTDIDRLDIEDLNGALGVIEGVAPNLGSTDEDDEYDVAKPAAYTIENGEYHVPLLFPLGDEEEIGEIVLLRRPTAGDLRVCDEIKGTLCQAREMLVRISNLTKRQINQIDGEDFQGLVVLLANFTPRGRKTGGTS